MQTLEEGPDDEPAVHGVQVDEPIVDDVPAGQTAHEAPGAKNIPAAQEYCVGLAVGAAVGDTEGVAVGSNVGAAVGDTEGVAVGILVGSNVDAVVRDTEGAAVGILVGSNVGAAVGDTEGVAVGILVGSNVGAIGAGRVLMAEQLEESREEYGVS